MSRDTTRASEPMDPGATEGTNPESYIPNERAPYALEQLVEEVREAFDVTVTWAKPDYLRVYREVQFGDVPDALYDVLLDVADDERILNMGVGEGYVYVGVVVNPYLSELRSGYGIAALLEVYEEDETGPYHGDLTIHKVAQARKAPARKRAPRKTAAKKS